MSDPTPTATHDAGGLEELRRPSEKGFPNYAGRADRDDAIAAELREAGIEVSTFQALRSQGEVKTAVVGELHGWGFRRAWCYWTAEGPGIEVSAAEALYKSHPRTVRVEGHCGCPSPRNQFKGLAVGSYHVDSREGLKALADTIRSIVERPATVLTQTPPALDEEARKALEPNALIAKTLETTEEDIRWFSQNVPPGNVAERAGIDRLVRDHKRIREALARLQPPQTAGDGAKVRAPRAWTESREQVAARMLQAFPDLTQDQAECAAEAAFPECLVEVDLAAAPPPPEAKGAGDESLSRAVRDVVAERRRQVEVEGWTVEHDDAHDDGSLARAAGCYAVHAGSSLYHASDPASVDRYRRNVPPNMTFPWGGWHGGAWKPTTPRRDLVKAVALAIAEIERLDRLAPPADQDGSAR